VLGHEWSGTVASGSRVVAEGIVPCCHCTRFGYTSSAWRDVVVLLNSGRLELAFLVTHRFGLPDWKQALDALRGPDSPRGKVLLEVNS
jgi:hypothetical protein